MRLVTQDKRNMISHNSDLSITQSDALRCVFTGERSASKVDNDLAQRLLRKAWHDRQWLECDCRSIHGKAPVMGIRRSFTDIYTLVRLSGRPLHTQTCPFKQVENPLRKKRERHSQSTISHLLAVLIEELQLARYAHDPAMQPFADLKALYARAREFIQAQTGKQALNEQLVITHPGRMMILINALRKQNGDTGRIGMLFTTIDSFQDGKMIYQDRRHGRTVEIDLNSNIKLDSPVCIDADCPGPYLVMVEIAESGSRRHWFEPVTVSRLPVYDKRTLFPVTSGAERTTLTVLFKVQSWLHEKKQRAILIEKPLESATKGLRVYTETGNCISIETIETESDRIELPKVQKGEAAPLFHMLIRQGEQSRQQQLTRKFQQILIARILSADTQTQAETDD